MDLDHLANQGSGVAFTLARRVAQELLKRSIKEKLRVIVEREVEIAVRRQFEEVQERPAPGLIQIVIGEVYNVAERVEGVVRIDDTLHFEEGAISLDPVPVDDPRLTSLVQRAQTRLNSMIETGTEMGPKPHVPAVANSIEATIPEEPTIDSKQRLSRAAARRYRESLDLTANEDRAR